MHDFQLAHIIYMLIWLALVSSAYWHMRGNPRKELRNALAWVLIVSVLVAGYTLFVDTKPAKPYISPSSHSEGRSV